MQWLAARLTRAEQLRRDRKVREQGWVLAGCPVGTTATRKQLEASGKKPQAERQLLRQRLALVREAFPLGVAAWLITAGLFESGLLKTLASPAEMQDQFAKTVWHHVQDETFPVQLCGPWAQLSSTESQSLASPTVGPIWFAAATWEKEWMRLGLLVVVMWLPSTIRHLRERSSEVKSIPTLASFVAYQ